MLDQNPECSKIVPLLDAFHDGELADGEKDAVATHLHTCDSCQARLKEIEKLVASMHALPRLEMPHALQLDWKALLERRQDAEKPAPESQPVAEIQAEGKIVPVDFAKGRRALVAVAALLVLLVCAATLIGQNLKPSNVPSIADNPVAPGESGSAQKRVSVPMIAARENAGSKAGNGAASQAAQDAGNGELIALYPSDTNLVSEEIGIATDEDGLYALKL
jgi:anti-sigma factor RsiW